jgi:3'-5' exonuclease
MLRAVIDIETVPIVFPQNEGLLTETEQKDSKSAALDALTGRIVCVGIIVVKNEYEAVSGLGIVSHDEKKLLEHLWSSLREAKVSSFVGHNGLAFDLPFLWKRSVIHAAKPSISLDLRKYRRDFMFDTMAVWANWDPRNYTSLDTLAQSLGLGGKYGAADQVLDLWRTSRHADLVRYCLRDCWLTYGCYCRMNFRNPVAENDIPTELRTIEPTPLPEDHEVSNLVSVQRTGLHALG